MSLAWQVEPGARGETTLLVTRYVGNHVVRKGPAMELVEQEDWPLHAKCRGMADALFPEGKDQKRARAVCMGCPVRPNCLAEALDNRIEWGVWGGLTERERRQLLRQRPDITSWAEVLLAPVDPMPIDSLAGDKRSRRTSGKRSLTPSPWHSGKTADADEPDQG